MFDNTGWCATSEDPNALVGPLACVLPLPVLRCAYILSASAHAPSAQAAQILGGVLFSTITLVDARDGAAFYIFWAPSPTSKTTANSFAPSRRTSTSLRGTPSTPSPLVSPMYGALLFLFATMINRACVPLPRLPHTALRAHSVSSCPSTFHPRLADECLHPGVCQAPGTWEDRGEVSAPGARACGRYH